MSKSKKLNLLFETFEELSLQLKDINSPRISAILESWKISISESKGFISCPDAKIKPSLLISGFEQGLRETPSVLMELPESEREIAIRIFYRVVNNKIPQFFDNDKSALRKILLKNEIKNESEWYLVRARIDDLERDVNNHDEELKKLGAILFKYEESV